MQFCLICVSPDICYIWLLRRAFLLVNICAVSLSCVAHLKVKKERSRRSQEFLVPFSFTHSCVWLLFLLVNPKGHEQTDYLFIDVLRSAYSHGIYANSFASKLLTKRSFYFSIQTLIHPLWLFFSFSFCSFVVIHLPIRCKDNIAAGM